MSRLEELYSGDLYPAERIEGRGEEFQEIENKLDEIWKKLRKKLPPEEFRMVEQLNEEIRKGEAIRNQEGFIYGFRLAVQLLVEGMQPLG